MAVLEEHNALLAGAPFEIKPLTPTIGAELHGIDLGADLPDSTIMSVKAALLKHKVIFFRDQDISRADHIRFARRFGPLEIHPATPADQDDREVLRIVHNDKNKGAENAWHSDVTWRPEPSLGSILRSIEVPETGGDTLFSDMEAAYEALSPEMQKFVCGLTAAHDFMRVFGSRFPPEKHAELRKNYPLMEHPVVRTHPETGARSLYVNVAFTDHIKGLSEKESRWLLDHLYSFAATPEFQCRFRWEKNSLAFWDNRACQHYAASDYWPAVRTMERVTIAGDKPFFRE